MKFFDPACGCGNFLIIAYRELRELEMEVIRELRAAEAQRELDVAELSRITVDQFYGIELGEFPSRIAETALWMMDHIMNNRLSLEFGQTYTRIPLTTSPHVLCADALETDWATLLPPADCSFVFGNPPFVGAKFQTGEQRLQVRRIADLGRSGGTLDYVTAWFIRAGEYLQKSATRIGFVATNSVTQGEQAAQLWPMLFGGGLSIRFAHRTFQWNSEARGSAAVHCVIIGMTFAKDGRRAIYDYDHVRGEPHESEVKQINGYLIDGPQYTVRARSRVPEGRLRMHKGSQPTDGARLKKPEGGYITFSNLILNEEDRAELLAVEPECEKWLKPYVGGDELISGKWRWCLWLKDADPAELRASKAIKERLERVRNGRLQSPTASVREYAKFPTLFTQDRQPTTQYLAVPEVSSETREYIPMAMLSPAIISSSKLMLIPGASLLYFGILTSAMHMAWMRTVAGRLKSDYSYSPAIYNSFVWPEMTNAQESRIVDLSQAVLDARAAHPDATLADLYDPDLMPPDLRRAHQALDRAVDALYRRTGFASERERVEHLFALYEKMRAPLEARVKKKPRRRRR